jgi:polyhydroxyalkanoate synthesis repressor PhaR
MLAPKVMSLNDPSETFSIKKYGNRRFYSSEHSRFVTLEEIAAWVSEGRRVRVHDAKTEEDITSDILTQILLEQGRARHFPVDFLEQMLRLNEKATRGFWELYVARSRQTFSHMQRDMEQFYQSMQSMWAYMGSLPRSAEGRDAPASDSESSTSRVRKKSKEKRAE